MVSVGTIVWLSSELMFFASLFAMYFTVRSVNEPDWPPHDVVLDLKTAAPFTIILVLSSVTCQLGVFAAERGDAAGLRYWFIVTCSSMRETYSVAWPATNTAPIR